MHNIFKYNEVVAKVDYHCYHNRVVPRVITQIQNIYVDHEVWSLGQAAYKYYLQILPTNFFGQFVIE